MLRKSLSSLLWSAWGRLQAGSRNSGRGRRPLQRHSWNRSLSRRRRQSGVPALERLEARQLLSATASGAEYRVNAYTTSIQSQPSMAMDSAGNYVVTWQSYGQDGDGYGIYAQRFNAAGVAQGSEFRVNTYTTYYQFNPSAAMDSDGDFVITWVTDQEGSSNDIYAQRYNALGEAQGTEFRVNTYTTDPQYSPSAAMDSDGDFVVTWQSYGQDGDGYGIYAQRFNAAGVAQGSEFQVNTYTTSYQYTASAAMDSDGDFVITWQSYGQDGSGYGIYAQRYNAAGVAQGSEFQVSSYTTNNQNSSSAAMDSDGDFVISWQSSGQDGSGYGVYAKRFNASGVAQGSEFRVNTYTTSSQYNASPAMNAAGNFVISWQSSGQDGNGLGIYAQYYNAAGVAQGSEFRANSYTTNSQANPTAAMNSTGNFVIAWQSSGQDGSSNGIYSQRYSVGAPPTDISLSANTVSEIASIGTTIGTLTATDADSPESFTYRLLTNVESPANGLFLIDGDTLKTAGALNYEAVHQYSVDIEVTDSTAQTFVKTFTITVTDSNEFAVSAVSDTNGDTNTIAENAAAGTVGITASASDADGTTNAVSYSLTDNAGGLFTIDSTTGVVSTTGPLNYETATSYTITVRAESADGSFSAADFTITVTDIDESDVSPITDSDSASNTIAENAAAGTVGITASASDADGTTNTVTYSLTDNAGGLFTIDSATGVVSTTGPLDYETATSYSITVRAESADGSFSTADFTIAVTDVDESDVSSITDTDTADNTITESADAGTVGITASASDADGTTNTVTYSLTDNAGGLFTIDSTTGVVSTTGPLNYETATSYTITVRAESEDGSFSAADFTVTVTDVDESDVSPITDSDSASNTIAENADAGTVGITASASDADGTTNTVTYSLTDNAGGLFTIDSTTGVVSTTGPLNYETATSYTITVRAESEDGSFSTTDFTIAVTDVDESDVSGVTDTDSTDNTISENAAAGPVGITAFASDADGTTNAVSYSLTDNAGGLFTIDSISGVVSTTGPLDYETATSYSITVRAESADGSFSIADFTIAVTDVDEFDVSAIADADAADNTIAENADAGPVGITASASDSDGATNTVTYSLTDDAGGLFTIDSISGVVSTTGPLNYETATSYSITVRAESADGSFSTENFTIAVTDVNEFDVSDVIDTNCASNVIAENAAAGPIGITAFADDEDGTTNGVTYSLTDDAGGLFTINSCTGVVSTTGPLDYETACSYSITVRAESADGSFSMADFTVNVLNVNESPVISGVTGSTSYIENAAPRILTTDGVINDPDGNFCGGSLTVRFRGFSETGDRLSILSVGTSTGQISVTGNDVFYGCTLLGTVTSDGTGGQNLVIQLAAGADNAGVQQLLRSITYASVSENPSTTQRRVEFVLKDGVGTASNVGAKVVRVTAVNDKPVITGVTGSTTYTENAAPLVLATDGVISDLDDNLGEGSLTVRFNGFSEADDRLSILSVGTGDGQISVTGNDVFYGGSLLGTISSDGTGGQNLVIQLASGASSEAVQQLLRSITYASVSENPNTTQRRVEFALRDGDGANSNVGARIVKVKSVNDKPVITGVTGTATYSKSGLPIALATGGDVSDLDWNMAGGSLTARFNGFSEANDRLSIISGGTGTGEINVSGNDVYYEGDLIGSITSNGIGGQALTITLTAAATPDAVRHLLHSLTYASDSTTPTTTNRRVEFLLTDSSGAKSNTAARVVKFVS
ncbi:cadherin domain-containing protein [Planctomicrobium piriforme]|uniref:Cadherin domain-containing protein n=1 Tax=Planctomicrobium piriforme TaxID=1576369 RepID=A0A1I3HHI0_9PLAN|nr:cadherin domain-containing protein [Planctomicrobium piriforme]SFI35079.1 Cadherin domain-containing protein [Planctomicrobium piriforme]